MTIHANWTGDLINGAIIFVATSDGQLHRRKVVSVSDRFFTVEGVCSNFDKLNACTDDGATHAYPDDYDSRELYQQYRQKKFLMSIPIKEVSSLQIGYMLAALELTMTNYGYTYPGRDEVHLDPRARLAMSISDSLHPMQIAYILAGFKLSLLLQEVNHDC